MKCALCKNKECRNGKDCTEIIDKVRDEYKGQRLKSMQVSASIESEHYLKKTRVEELILYAKDMGYKKLGMAFCVGLSREAEVIHKILEVDFEDIGLYDLFRDEAVIAVEWSEKLDNDLLTEYIAVEMNFLGNHSRQIIFIAYGLIATDLLKRFEHLYASPGSDRQDKK